MTEEQIRQLAKEEFLKNIKNNLDSALIFTYVSELEKEVSRINHECDTYLKIATKRKNRIDELEKENQKLNNIIKNLDKMFEYYFLGNLKYDQDTVNTIYIKYVKLKELKESK